MARILSAHVLALTLVSTGVLAATTSPTGTSATPISAKPALVMIKPTETETARARTYSFKPANVLQVVREDQNDGPSLIVRNLGVRPATPTTPRLNVAKFGEAVHAALKDNVRGYALGLRKNGQPVLTLIWEWARSPQEGSRGWTLDTRMHVASVSKLITGIVATKMLDERNLSFDTKIGPYIPAYWNEGASSNDVTFRQLLTHSAGFTNHEGDYLSFKSEIERGVTPGASLGYTNGSFSLIRVLNATMTGAVNRNAKWDFAAPTPQLAAQLNDVMWDMKSTSEFVKYAQDKVFTPSGVSNVSAMPDPTQALAYAGKIDNAGWNSGDLTTQLGGAGFRLSVNEVLNVMGTFRRSGKIVSAEKAKQSIEARLGIDQVIDTPAGKIYNKNGAWRTGTSIMSDIEQSVAYYLQEDMECVVLVNSWIGVQQASLRNTIRDAYINNLQ